MPAEYGLLILAAGGSTRLGQPKQLLIHRGKSLLRNVIDETRGLPNVLSCIVLGAYHELVAKELSEGDRRHHHTEWQEGMGSTIRSGLKAILEAAPDLRGVLLTLCDQPFVSRGLFETIVRSAEHEKIVACGYGDTIGTPAYFDASFFPALLSLSGDAGAKKLLLAHRAEAKIIPFERGEIDIDSEEDYMKLTDERSSNRAIPS